ncbi:bifunctional phosphopantothenoylcysteine decarboxylase/phosphopantothenate--cysteine ligase CoaBC [Zavarzinia compransoris]|nr:bifunctional phosphopantothenoylcysteine decarboxylase/phosphopantothenate--cysteine ligase CoaBC [Zavarzinia marina]
MATGRDMSDDDKRAERRILLIVGGGIAAYKALELTRRLRERGIAVRAVLTRAGQQFITPLSLSAITGDKVYTDLFSLTDEADMGHIQLSRDADLVVVCPATADLMAKMAAGIADDLATTALLATDKPVLIAPAMNVRMWNHKATRRNHARLLADGIMAVGPDDGDMACGEFGPGRLAEPADILEKIEAFFRSRGEQPMVGKRVVVTSGPTHEPIDPVRYIANRSSGQQGHALASALAALGAQVTLVSGPVSLADPAGVEVRHVETARQMAAAVDAALPADVVVCAAAVADWRVAGEADQKIKKDGSGQAPALAFVENPDILATVSRAGPRRPPLVVGFAAETEKVVEHAKAKLARKNCDWIIANDVGAGPEGGVMGAPDNAIHIVTADGVESWPRLAKTEVATRLAARIAQTVKERNI